MNNPNPINKDTSGLDQVFDTMEEATTTKVVSEKNKVHLTKGEDVDKDYDYARGNLYSLIDKGQEAVNGALDLAMSSDHPRAYEVAGQLIKHVGDVADKLMALQKDKKAIKDEGPKKVVTNNSLFVGSTADLQKMLKEASKKKDK
tara:strand:- start:979 stop:1413 length:435 start_codon:yes stop_codon:yes gene_type:complete